MYSTKVLDHGFVEVVDYMGSDLSVVNAARVSFDKESAYEVKLGQVGDGDTDVGWITHLSERDRKLIKYLANHNHWTPFGHTSLTYRIKAPLFVARQLAKHQVGLVWNEVSRRYVDSPPEFYRPDLWRRRADNVKQGSSAQSIEDSAWAYTRYDELITKAQFLYREFLEAGVCPEQARMLLPQSMYTEWVWTGSLAAWARIYKLRTDPHAQLEVYLFARALGALVPPGFEHSWEALTGERNHNPAN